MYLGQIYYRTRPGSGRPIYCFAFENCHQTLINPQKTHMWDAMLQRTVLYRLHIEQRINNVQVAMDTDIQCVKHTYLCWFVAIC